MDEMIKSICKYPNGTYLKVYWESNQLVLFGTIDTVYESNNGLDDNHEEYREFYACAFRIEKVLENSTNHTYAVNSLIELSIENQPSLITLSNGDIIWQKD